MFPEYDSKYIVGDRRFITGKKMFRKHVNITDIRPKRHAQSSLWKST